MTTKQTRKASAQRLDAAFSFDLTAVAGAVAVESFARIPVLPAQGAIGRDGRGPFTYDIAVVVANVRANGADIPVFLDHEPGLARGWIDHKADPFPMADGSWEWPVSYTDEGLALLMSRAYRYNSPTWLFIQDPAVTDRQAGRIVGVLEVSLTNLPNQFLRSLNAAESGAYTVDIPVTTPDSTVTPEQLAALGLTETATAEEITAAITALTATATAATAEVAAIIAAAGAEASADAAAVVEAAANSRVASGALVTKQAFDEVTATLAIAVNARDAAVSALAALQSEQAAQAVTAAVDASIAAGKFTPAARESLHSLATKDLAAFTTLAAATAQHAAAKPFATPSATDETFGLSAENLKICKAQNIEPAIFAKNLRLNA